MLKRTIWVTIIMAIFMLILFTCVSAATVNGEWEYYLGSQHEYGFGDTRDCWQRLFRKNTATGEKQQITFGQAISKYIVLDSCIIFSEYSGDYMGGARQGETYAMRRIDKDGGNEILLDDGYEIDFYVRNNWVYYTAGKDIRKINVDGSGKTVLELNEKYLWYVGNIAFFISGDYLYSSLWLESGGKCEGSALIRINLDTEIEETLFFDEKNEVWGVSPSSKHEKMCYMVRDEEWHHNVYFMNFDGSDNVFLYSDPSGDAAHNSVSITSDWIYFGCMDMLQGEVIRNEVFRYRHDGSGYESVHQNPGKPFHFWENKAIVFDDWSYSYVTEVDLSDSIPTLIRNSVMLKVGNCDTIAFGAYSGVDQSNAMVVPYIDNGRTMIPVRFISETFGGEVTWNPDANTVTISLNGRTIEMIIGETQMHVDNKEVAMDTAPQVKDGRTFLPLRALCEALDKNVFWNDGIIVISDEVIDEESLVKSMPQISDEFYGIGLF